MSNDLTTNHAGVQTEVPRPASSQSITFAPRVDILETEQELLLLADMPGIRPNGVDIRYENGELVLHGRNTPPQSSGDQVRSEYAVGDFYRAFSIAEGIDPDRIAAEMKNGVLTVHLPKSEKAKPKRIAVQGQ